MTRSFCALEWQWAQERLPSILSLSGGQMLSSREREMSKDGRNKITSSPLEKTIHSEPTVSSHDPKTWIQATLNDTSSKFLTT